MRILLAQTTVALPTHGGENKANRLLAEALAAAGHEVLLVAPAVGVQGAQRGVGAELEARGIAGRQEGETWRWRLGGVEVAAATRGHQVRELLQRELAARAPEVVLVSSQDPGQVLADTALASALPTVLLAHTLSFLPFGPLAYRADPAAARRLQQLAGTLTVSAFAQAWLREHGGLESQVVRFPVELPPPRSGPHDAVGLFNPCPIKGIDAFLHCAQALPAQRFLAISGWGTTEASLARLGRLPNVEVVEPRDEVGALLAELALLMVPSLVPETLGQVVLEAMHAGVAVISSDAGGLPEAGLGVAPVVPVQPLTGYAAALDAQGLPVPILPAQDPSPWIAAVGGLLAAPDALRALAERGRVAAEGWGAGVDLATIEAALDRVARVARRPVQKPGTASARLAALSPERRAALAALARRRAQPVQSPATRPVALSSPAPSEPVPPDSLQTLHEERLELLVARGAIEPPLAVAITCFPIEWFPPNDPRRLGMVAALQGRPILRDIATTPLGRVGTLVLPIFADTVFQRQAELLDLLEEGLRISRELGAVAASLFNPIPFVTDYGRRVRQGAMEGRVTTGQGTIGASVLLGLRALREAGGCPSTAPMAAIGVHALAAAVIEASLALDPPPERLILADVPERAQALQTLAARLRPRATQIEVQLEGGLPEACLSARLSYTSVPGPPVVDVARLRPGTLLVDDSIPVGFDAARATARTARDQDLLWRRCTQIASPKPIPLDTVRPKGSISALPPDYFLRSPDTHFRCALAAILMATRDDVEPLLRPPTGQDVLLHHAHLVRAGFHAPAPGLEPWLPLSDDDIRAFRARFGEPR